MENKTVSNNLKANVNNEKIVKIGSKVKIYFYKSKKEAVYEIAFFGDLEKNIISSNSPLATAILGAKEGSEVKYLVGGVENKVKIIEIK